MKKFLVILVVTVFVLGLAALYFVVRSAANSPASQLRNFIVPPVSIENGIYNVENGKVLNGGKTVSGPTAERAFLLAHAAVLSRIDPLFALDGTDQDKLKESLQELDGFVRRILPFYNSNDALKIKNYQFPLDFLNSLADAESARQIFIQTPSEENAREYYKKLGTAIDLDIEYAKNIETLFRDPEIIGDSPGRFGFLGGYTTPVKYALAINKYRLSVEDKKLELEKRIACLDKFSPDCAFLKSAFANLTQMSGITFTPQEPLPQEAQDNRQLVKNLLTVIAQSAPNDFPVVAVEDSLCFARSPHAYYQTWINTGINGGRTFSLYVISDLYFYDSKLHTQEVRVTPYVRKNIPYLYQPAANLYMCATAGNDLTRAITLDEIRTRILNTKDLALIDQSTAELGEKIAAQDTIYEAEVREYVDGLASLLSARGEKAFAKKTNTETVLDVEKILLIWRQRSPRFDEIIRDVIKNEQGVIILGQKGAPIPLFTVLLARSYLPITLLSYNRSVVPNEIDVTIPVDYDISEFKLVSYNDEIKKNYSTKQVQEMMIQWSKLEK
jgi:hypothetical protein